MDPESVFDIDFAFDTESTLLAGSRKSERGEKSGQIVPYEYACLGPREIRLVDAYRKGGSQMACEFIHVPLDHCLLKYQAFSYTWGDPTTVSMISRGESYSLDITASVAAILTEFVEKRTEGEYYWIDCLCIDQTITKSLWFRANQSKAISTEVGHESSHISSLVDNFEIEIQAKNLGTGHDTPAWVGPYRECNAHVAE